MALKLMSGGRGKTDPIRPAPPSDLGPAGRELWSKLTTAYRLEDEAGQCVLAIACRAADRADTCRVQVAKDGLTVKDRWRQVRPHPLLAIERSARGQMMQALKQLQLPIPEA